MARRQRSSEPGFQLFSFLDILTGLVGVLMFMLILYSIQLREVENPIADLLMSSDGSRSDVAKAFFLVVRKGWAVMLPEGLCAPTDTLDFDGGFDRLMERKIELVQERSGAKEGEVAAIILIQDEAGIPVKNKLKRLLRRRNVERGFEIINETKRTDRTYLIEQAKDMGVENKIVEMPIDLTLTNLPDLFLLDKFNMPRPLIHFLRDKFNMPRALSLEESK